MKKENMKRNILFVDDENGVFKGFRHTLFDQLDIWEMSYVSGMHAALGRLEETRFDVIVSSVKMFGKNGFNFLKMLQAEKTKNIPAIILTDCQDNDFKRSALELGVTGLLSKTVDKKDLFAFLNRVLRLKSHQGSLEQKVKEQPVELDCSIMDNIRRLGNLAEFHDEDTGNHVLRVGLYCKAIAEQLDTGQDFAERLFLTSPLHDIGKDGIPEDILLKPGKLTSVQWEIMKQHCVIGAEIFYQDSRIRKLFCSLLEKYAQIVDKDRVNLLHKMAATIALTHHEKWDGTGYPKGLAGKDIPFESRITAIADVYDALSSVRPYKPAFSESKVRSIMAEEVGRYFDPEIYDAFEKSAEQIKDIKARFTDYKMN